MTITAVGTADTLTAMAAESWAALGGATGDLARLQCAGSGALRCRFPVSDLAAASVGVAGLAVAEWAGGSGPVRVDRRLASLWFGSSLRPAGWALPDTWDAMAGNYRAADGWVRLHTNAQAHREAALRALELPGTASRAQVAACVSQWRAMALESAVVAAGGVAGELRSLADWRAHPQGVAVASEPLVDMAWRPGEMARPGGTDRPDAVRPLAGIRVLDLTRVLAGPCATRLLAGFGADVLRIDPAGWNESTVPEMTLGKRCAQLDLRAANDRAVFERLLGRADVLVHGYRGDALDALGFDAEHRRALRPGLIDVSLCAFGWTGPWRHRRGFDTVVQMSAGLAHTESAARGSIEGLPVQALDGLSGLPVQALDYATGYLMAAACLRGLVRRRSEGAGLHARLSLARTAHWLASHATDTQAAAFAPETVADLDPWIEHTEWGPAQRLRAPLAAGQVEMQWTQPAGSLRRVPAEWPAARQPPQP